MIAKSAQQASTDCVTEDYWFCPTVHQEQNFLTQHYLVIQESTVYITIPSSGKQCSKTPALPTSNRLDTNLSVETFASTNRPVAPNRPNPTASATKLGPLQPDHSSDPSNPLQSFTWEQVASRDFRVMFPGGQHLAPDSSLTYNGYLVSFSSKGDAIFVDGVPVKNLEFVGLTSADIPGVETIPTWEIQLPNGKSLLFTSAATLNEHEIQFAMGNEIVVDGWITINIRTASSSLPTAAETGPSALLQGLSAAATDKSQVATVSNGGRITEATTHSPSGQHTHQPQQFYGSGSRLCSHRSFVLATVLLFILIIL